jgi:hypothetical protein
MKKIVLIFFCLLCLMGSRVKTGYDKLTDFSQYKTYSWIAKATRNAWTVRIMKHVDAQLAAKGWTKVQAGGDVVVAAFGRVNDKETLQSFYTGADGDFKWQGLPDGTEKVDNTDVGTLLVDVFDGKSKKLIWRSSATETFSGKPNQAQLEESVQDMFKDFPKPQP